MSVSHELVTPITKHLEPRRLMAGFVVRFIVRRLPRVE